MIDPEIRRPVTELDMIGAVSVDDAGAASIDLKLTIVGRQWYAPLAELAGDGQSPASSAGAYHWR